MALMKINAPQSQYHGEVVQVLTMSSILGLATVRYQGGPVVPVELSLLIPINPPTNRGNMDVKMWWTDSKWKPKGV